MQIDTVHVKIPPNSIWRYRFFFFLSFGNMNINYLPLNINLF